METSTEASKWTGTYGFPLQARMMCFFFWLVRYAQLGYLEPDVRRQSVMLMLELLWWQLDCPSLQVTLPWKQTAWTSTKGSCTKVFIGLHHPFVMFRRLIIWLQ